MTLSQSYARALFEAAQTGGTSAELIQNLRGALARRGHDKLLPRILADYEKLELGRARIEEYKAITPEAERTRNLLELYRKLIATPTA